MIKILKYFFQSIIIYLLFIIVKIIGLSLSRSLFAFLFKNIGPIMRSNKIASENLKKFSKEINKQSEKNIIDNMWSNYGMTFVEYIFLKKFRNEDSHIFIKNENILNEIRENNQPVIFVSGHFANFELMSMEITKKNIKLATIYRPLNNVFLNPFMELIRKKFVCKNQIKKGLSGVKDCIDYINSKHNIALMIDQRVSEGDRITFFNSKAFTTTLPAQLALKYNLKIIPIFIERKNINKFEMEIYNPIDSSVFKNKYELSLELNKILECMIVKSYLILKIVHIYN